jgi:uncharacterized protein (TIGR02996 family)
MSHEEGFIRDILENPDDDTPRLVYADWLDDQGDVLRARFIRVQCEIASLPTTDSRLPTLREQEAELLDWHSHRWYPLPKGVVLDSEYERGFLARVSMLPQDFLFLSESLFSLTPVQHLRLKPLFGCGISTEMIERVVNNPLLKGLRSLALAGNGLDNSAAIAIASSPHLDGLRTLDLSNNYIGRDGGLALARSPHLQQLKRLDLRGNALHGAKDVLLQRFAERVSVD